MLPPTGRRRRSRKHQNNAGKPDRLDTDHGGHFIAREFGGPKIALNHFAQDARSNRSEYRSLELSWKAYLKQGKKVSVNIVPSYIGRSRRPTSLDVTFYVGRVRKKRTIINSTGER
jgi:DNA/RNA non-specific endonuclease